MKTDEELYRLFEDLMKDERRAQINRELLFVAILERIK